MSFLPLEHGENRAGDLRLADGHDLVDGFAADGERLFAGCLDLNAVGDRVHLRKRQDMPRAEGVGHARRPGGLHADNAAGGFQLPQGARDTRDQPSAADRDEDNIHIRQLLGDLEPDRPLSRHGRARRRRGG